MPDSDDQLRRPQRMSDLCVNCAIFLLDVLAPTDIPRGSITIPENVRRKHRARQEMKVRTRVEDRERLLGRVD